MDRVECYSGHTYPQEPRAVVWQGRRFPVIRIERRWRTPEGPAFCVETEPGIPFELHYGELDDLWAIQPLSDLDADPPEPETSDGERNESGKHDPHLNHY